MSTTQSQHILMSISLSGSLLLGSSMIIVYKFFSWPKIHEYFPEWVTDPFMKPRLINVIPMVVIGTICFCKMNKSNLSNIDVMILLSKYK